MTHNRVDLPGLRLVDASMWPNPIWYVVAVVAGITSLVTMFKHIQDGMSLGTGVWLFVVIPLAIPVCLICLGTSYTNWNTNDQGLTRGRFAMSRQLPWSDVTSARFLGNGKTELVFRERRVVVPAGNLALTASVWQHLRGQNGFELPEPIVSVWDAPPKELPDEFTWENPRRIGFWAVHWFQVLAVLVILGYLAQIFWKREKMPEDWIVQLMGPFPWIMFALVMRRLVARRITVGPEGIDVEPSPFHVRIAWSQVSVVRVSRKSVTLGLLGETIVPIAAADTNLPILLQVIRKHLRERATPVLFVIPPQLRLDATQLDKPAV